MILLAPSRTVKKETNIDYNVLGKILTTVLEHNHKKKIHLNIKIYKSKDSGTSSCYQLTKRNYVVHLDTSRDKYTWLFGSLLHELRHCIQYNLFGFWNHKVHFSTWSDYFYSKEEVDARKMERLTSQIIRCYESFTKLNKQFRDFELGKLGKLS
jgi:helix-turn-helix protein